MPAGWRAAASQAVPAADHFFQCCCPLGCLRFSWGAVECGWVPGLGWRVRRTPGDCLSCDVTVQQATALQLGPVKDLLLRLRT